jgi:hypothetical protein
VPASSTRLTFKSFRPIVCAIVSDQADQIRKPLIIGSHTTTQRQFDVDRCQASSLQRSNTSIGPRVTDGPLAIGDHRKINLIGMVEDRRETEQGSGAVVIWGRKERVRNANTRARK